MCENLAVLASSYFDAYPSLEVEDVIVSAKAAMEGLLNTLGWEFVRDEKYVEG